MKRQIRRGVFETNSSSMHSLVVRKCDQYFTEEEVRDQIYVGRDGLVSTRYTYQDGLYYGRYPFQILTSLKDKALYVLASMCRFKDDDVYNEVCETVRSYISEFKDFELSFEAHVKDKKYYTEESVENQYGKGNYIDTGERYVAWGYDVGDVDEDILSGFLEKENISITEFLKNKRYTVVVDGDEYCVYRDMKRCGFINTADIEREYPQDYKGCDE